MNKLILVFAILIGFLSCQQKPMDYATWVEKEKSKSDRIDTLFHGMHFGMTQQEFYDRCWTLNKQGVLKDGNGNATARFRLETELEYPADFEFYPKFSADGKVLTMPAFVEYDGWAPWNKHLFSNVLIEDTKKLLSDWYKIDFVPIKSPSTYGKAYLGIQANMKIVMYYANDNQVKLLYSDLSSGEDIPNQILQ